MFLYLNNARCHRNMALVLSGSVLYQLLQVFEKFTKESTSLLDELSIINESDKSSSVDKDKYVLFTHRYTHAQTHTLSYSLLKVDRLSPQLCVCLSSADQLTVPSYHPLTLRLFFRRVNMISNSSRFQTCTLLRKCDSPFNMWVLYQRLVRDLISTLQ